MMDNSYYLTDDEKKSLKEMLLSKDDEAVKLAIDILKDNEVLRRNVYRQKEQNVYQILLTPDLFLEFFNNRCMIVYRNRVHKLIQLR